MSIQDDIETFLKTDLFTVAGASMYLKASGDVYPDARVRVNRSANEILFGVERGNPVNRSTGRALVVMVTVQLFMATHTNTDLRTGRVETALRESAQVITKAYDSWRGATKFRAALNVPVDTVTCEEGVYDTIFPGRTDPDQRTHHTKMLTMEIHCYDA